MSGLNGSATPLCSVCIGTLGAYGGPTTLPCGHNGCIECLTSVQQRHPVCPLCRTAFPADVPLQLNLELRELVALAAALNSVSIEDDGNGDGWQTVTSSRPYNRNSDYGRGDDDEYAVPCLPMAPRTMMRTSMSAVQAGQATVLTLDPPTWQPDSSAAGCTRCKAPFGPLRCWRHHCRLCGKIFCHACSSRRMLLPQSFQRAQPERVCVDCSHLLEPRQAFLAGTISRAVQPAIHDVTDYSSLRSYINLPTSDSLETHVFQATNIIRSFMGLRFLSPEKSIPPAILRNASGFAVLSVAKAAMGWSAAMGSGLVVARRAGGGWSLPCAISLYSLGWGLQAGGALCDLLIVLRNPAAVRAFCGALHCGVGVGANFAAGPLGRQAEAGMHLGTNGSAALCYSYSRVRGAFVGVSVEGSLISTRKDLNMNFYGREVSARQLLLEDSINAPAADVLHRTLDDLVARMDAEAIAAANATKQPALPWHGTGEANVNGPSTLAAQAHAPAAPALAASAVLQQPAWANYPQVSAPPAPEHYGHAHSVPEHYGQAHAAPEHYGHAQAAPEHYGHAQAAHYDGEAYEEDEEEDDDDEGGMYGGMFE